MSRSPHSKGVRTYHRQVRGWLLCHGVQVDRVISQEAHDRFVKQRGFQGCPSKYPPAFGIDLHVDNEEGVRLEGLHHGFDVVIVQPHDLDWAARVIAAVDHKMPLRPRETC